MKQEFFNLKVKTSGQKLYEFTYQTDNWVKKITLIMELLI